MAAVYRDYQLCNRFAWAWKVASFGVPVILVYLGFLQAAEMGGAFANHAAWRECLIEHARDVAPVDVWDRQRPAGSSWFVPTIRSARISAVVKVAPGSHALPIASRKR